MSSENQHKKTLVRVPFNLQLEIIDRALKENSRTTSHSEKHHNSSVHVQQKYNLAALAAAAAVQHQHQQSFFQQNYQGHHHSFQNHQNQNHRPNQHHQTQSHHTQNHHARLHSPQLAQQFRQGQYPMEYQRSQINDIKVHDQYQKPYDFRSAMNVTGNTSPTSAFMHPSTFNSSVSIGSPGTQSVGSVGSLNSESSLSFGLSQPVPRHSSPPVMPLTLNTTAPSLFGAVSPSTSQWGRQSIWGNGNSTSSAHSEGFGKIW